MREKWKLVLDKGCNLKAIFQDLSKAFDTLNHELLLAKLNAYGFSMNAIAYIKSYLSNRYQRNNINNIFSTRKNIYKCVTQGSVLGSLLFNIFINDKFYFIENYYLCNYPEDDTLYVFDCNMNFVKEKLYKDFEVLDTWFYDNYMSFDPGKCNFMCLRSNLSVDEIFVYKNFKLKNTSVNEILGKGGNKLNALTRMANILNSFQKNTLS